MKDFNIDVGQKIFNARKSLNMSRAELGKKVNLHESTVKRYEDGNINSLDVTKLKEFANALNISPAYLMGFESTEFLQTNISFLLNQECNNINSDTQVTANTLKEQLIKKSSVLNDMENLNLVINFIEKLIENENYKDNIK